QLARDRTDPAERAWDPRRVRRIRRRAALLPRPDSHGRADDVPGRRRAARRAEAVRLPGIRRALYPRASARRPDGVVGRRVRGVLQLWPVPGGQRGMTIACPTPLTDIARVQLGHGSGGKLSAALVRERFLPHFDNPILAQLGDAAIVDVAGQQLAMSTDTFVVQPLEFPGGNIGSLAVHGTVNDLAMMGARPEWMSAAFVLEEGLPLDVLDRIVQAMAEAARAANVLLVTGDTKVVERGKADGVFINTTGLGKRWPDFAPGPTRAQPGDAVIVSGPIGRHGIAIMSAREGIAFDTELRSDSAALTPLVELLRAGVGDAVHTLRDPTRGGVASALNEIAAASRIGVELDEAVLP